MNKNNYMQIKIAYKNNTPIINEGFKRGGYTPFGCPASKICPNSKEKKIADDISCKAGFYCPPSSDLYPSELLPTKCPNGFYCPKNIKRPFACPSSKPNSRRMSTSINDCL